MPRTSSQITATTTTTTTATITAGRTAPPAKTAAIALSSSAPATRRPTSAPRQRCRSARSTHDNHRKIVNRPRLCGQPHRPVWGQSGAVPPKSTADQEKSPTTRATGPPPLCSDGAVPDASGPYPVEPGITPGLSSNRLTSPDGSGGTAPHPAAPNATAPNATGPNASGPNLTAPNAAGPPATGVDGRGVALGVAAYAVWGLFPAFWGLLEPASAVEILAQRIAWTMVLMTVVLTILRSWRLLRALSARGWLMAGAAAAAIAVNWGLFIFGVGIHHVVEISLGYFISPLLSVL